MDNEKELSKEELIEENKALKLSAVEHRKREEQREETSTTVSIVGVWTFFVAVTWGLSWNQAMFGEALFIILGSFLLAWGAHWLYKETKEFLFRRRYGIKK